LGLLQDSTLVRKRRSICHVPAPDPGDRLPLDYSPPDFYPRSRAGSCFFLLQVKQAAVGSHSCSAASSSSYILFLPLIRSQTATMVPFPYFLKKIKKESCGFIVTITTESRAVQRPGYGERDPATYGDQLRCVRKLNGPIKSGEPF
jgi:hypothetical protein